ncbi:MAG: Tim44-like domain-containing protein [Casimicrobiaceae bacterium]
MNRTLALAVGLLAVTAMFHADLVDAKRMGGGRSIGAQRQATPAPSAPSAAPAAPAGPMQSAAAPAAAGTAAKAAAPAASGMSRWMGPLAGLAAGLGLAALLSHFGLGEGFANILLLMLLAGGAFFLIRMFLSKRAPTKSPLQYAGSGPGLGTTPGGYETQAPRAPTNPAERFEPVFGGGNGAAVAAPAASKFPPGFNPGPFVEQAKLQFRALQAGYDTADRAALAAVMTPEMFSEIARELDDRGAHTATEVMKLDAEVLQIVTEGNQYWMNVHFKGLLREDSTVLPRDFDEVWNLVKPVDGSTGWLLAGIQQVNAVA